MDEQLSFGRDIQPILARVCFQCHGPDAAQRKAGLRLDEREAATTGRRGGPIILAGDPEASPLVQRITAPDPADRMPPPEAEQQLTPKEIQLLTRWIREGAGYEAHWAFVPVSRPPLPEVGDTTWARDDLDAFVLRRLEDAGSKPSPEADRRTWIRRVTLDLTGLPPTPTEFHAFLEDRAPRSYERVVDRLLASPHHAEHMARYWLDLARYADTDGYQYDKERQMWAWRDWVIQAYADNMPFDRFTIEQLAGDLLEGATEGQRVATGFNRNHPITIEGGIIDEEYRVEYVMDRVGTTATTWMGLTARCARCHDHKYDPLSQAEFFGLYAFFNQVPERGQSGFSPTLALTTSKAREEAAAITAELVQLKELSLPEPAEVAAWEGPLHSQARWAALGKVEEGTLLTPYPAEGLSGLRIDLPADKPPTLRVHPAEGSAPVGLFVRVDLPGREQYLSLAEVLVLSGGENVAPQGTATQSSTSAGGLAPRAIDGNTNGAHSNHSVTHTALEPNPWWEVQLAAPTPIHQIEIFNRTDCCSERLEGCRISILDEARTTLFEHTFASTPAPRGEVITGGPREVPLAFRQGVFTLQDKVTLPPGSQLELLAAVDAPVEFSSDANLREWAALPQAVARVLSLDTSNRSAAEAEVLAAHYLETHPSRAGARAALDALRTRESSVLEAGRTSVMVMADMAQPRATHILKGGQYDQPGELVEASVPAALPPMQAALPRNRLGLARWLTSPGHPLTARVAVNRHWQRLFGRGLVETLEDFGTRGARPSHPELLDWLAAEFVESGWDVRSMLRRLVLSSTYRQGVRRSAADRLADPEGLLLGHAPRLRLDAEVIRDQALSLAGLLEDEIGGPSVYPYQPAGLWMEINNRPGYARAYPKPSAAGVHRRSMYTFWKRTLPPPSMQIFDAPSREACTVLRSRTSTPLQALTLLHDPQFVEAARALGLRILGEASGSDADRLAYGFELVTGRAASPPELKELAGYLEAERRRFQADPQAVTLALGVGLASSDESPRAAEEAAWMSLGRLLLNLDEVIQRG